MDRQDIDALLISALYGELTPADEARLTAHLESHPADKSALVDLTRTRETVRESRFLTVQLEPPQAVSALLLQEATRNRKPVVAVEPPKESWFQRFVRSFAAHPAMAAAAMLVIVVGFAGVMWMRKGEMAAEQTAPASDRSVAAGAPATEPMKPMSEAEELRRNAGSGYAVQLEEGDTYRSLDSLEKKTTDDNSKGEAAKADAKPDAVAAKPPTVKSAPRTYIGTESPKYAPKDLESAPTGDLGGEDANSGRVATGGASGMRRPEVRRPDVVIADGKSPAPAPQADPTTTAIPRPGAGNKQTVVRGAGSASGPADESQLRDKDKVDEETRWARDQHAKVTAAVKANNCKEAASLALALSNRAPAYYGANVESDRELKQCLSYIVAEREREADRVQRARALEKQRASEPRAKPTQPAATDSKR